MWASDLDLQVSPHGVEVEPGLSVAGDEVERASDSFSAATSAALLNMGGVLYSDILEQILTLTVAKLLND